MTLKLFITYIALIILCSCSNNTKHDSKPAETIITPYKPTLLYDLNIDSLEVDYGIVKNHQTITKILIEAGLSYSQSLEAANSINEVFDIRTIRAGNKYTLFYSTDTTHQLSHFVYSISQRDFVHCNLRSNPYSASIKSQSVTTKERLVSATINTSLWNAIHDNGLPLQLALDLSDIYAWTIDFFGIEKGDSFSVIFNEDYVDSASIGISNIKAAKFISHGSPIYAFSFKSDTTESYFDLQGNSLKKAFLKAPLKYSRISSRFSNGRLHPILKIRRAHHGIDYAAPSGTPVMSIGDGIVIAKGWDAKGGGNYVKIKHHSVYTTTDMHLKNFAKNINQGCHVSQGQMIGSVGSTGLSTGPHLDFRVTMNGKPVDPLSIEAPPIEPISNDNMQSFVELSDSLKNILDKIETLKNSNNHDAAF